MTWQENDEKLVKEFVMKSFKEIITKLVLLNSIADEMNHHPDFCVYQYRKIKFTLCTHSAGNSLTEQDYNLAKKIDQLFEPELT